MAFIDQGRYLIEFKGKTPTGNYMNSRHVVYAQTAALAITKWCERTGNSAHNIVYVWEDVTTLSIRNNHRTNQRKMD